jgi:IclR family acetate operon transcriptional repressor
MGVEKRGSIQSVSRALEILDLLGDRAPEGVRVTEVAARLRVDPGTASRMLATLAGRGYASKLSDRSYTVGARSIRLATSWIDGLVRRSAGCMERISVASGVAVHLVQLLGQQAVTVARMTPGQRRPTSVEFSEAYPLWATAAGQALLAAAPATERMRLLPPEPYTRFTERTPTRWGQVWEPLRQGLRRGVFREAGQLHEGIGCLAVPLPRGGGADVLAIAVSFDLSGPEAETARLADVLLRESRMLLPDVGRC